MAIGVPVTADTLNARLGRALLNLTNALEDAPRLKEYLDQSSDAAIAAALPPLTAAEVNYIKGAVNALVTMGTIWRGEAGPAAHDYRGDTRQAYGLREA
jgi:hypothetical protein